MHHYSSSTSGNLPSIRPEAQALWSSYIPQQAIKHPFLMHGILALAALHLAYLHPDSATKYLQLGDGHQAVALQKFRTILSSDIDPQLADALFALSSVTSICSIGRSCVTTNAEALDMDSICELIWLTKGVRDVSFALYEYIKAGPMFSIYENRDCPEGVQVILPPSLSDRFAALRGLLTDLDPASRSDCEEAITELERVYRILQYFAAIVYVEIGSLYRWMVYVPDGFVRLVQARNPAALIILAFYATTFTGIRRSWHTQNFARYALQGISSELDEGLQHWLEWPRQQLDERLKILGADPQKGESKEPKPLIGF